MSTPRHGGRRGSWWFAVALAREPSASVDRSEACLPARDGPTAAAYRACGTVASNGNWLLLGAEVSRNLTQALVAPTGMGHGAWVRARNVQAGRQAEFAIRRPKGLHSTGTANRLGLLWNKVAALNTGTGRNLGVLKVEYAVRKVYGIAVANNAFVRRSVSAPGLIATFSVWRGRQTSVASRLAANRRTSIRMSSSNPGSGG